MEARRTCTRGQKMLFRKRIFAFTILWFLLFLEPHSFASNEYIFVVREAPYRRLCEKKKILTVNGQYPGPTLRVQRGDTVFVNVKNRGKSNITIHWHGVEQPRNPWSDGPAYITQCPIQPGKSFRQKVIFSREEGTLWWHAHSTWARATVHGAIIIYPKSGTSYPFPPPHAEVPIILGEWWKKDITDVYKEFIHSGGDPNVSDAFTINGQPGDLYPCSQSGTFKLSVDQGKTYLLRMVNAAMNTILFFSVAKHKLTVVGIDGSYTKALTKEFVMISPGQTMDALLEANQEPNQYYMAARAYSTGFNVAFDNTTTTAIVLYTGHYTPPSSPSMPYLPNYTDSTAAFSFLGSLKSLANEEHPVNVPLDIQTRMILTLSVNAFPCPHGKAPSSCQGPNVTRLAASMNNISFITPSTDILRAYYKHINGVFDAQFPNLPPLVFDFTAPYMPLIFEIPNTGTEVKVLEYNTTVEIVFQGTNLVAGIDHPIHLHGYSFYIIGFGFGNFDEEKDPLNYNLVDPPLRNTMTVPINGWSTIRFKTNNPGVWFMHCHIERHLTWGMETVFIVKNGRGKDAKLLPPPTGMPPC